MSQPAFDTNKQIFVGKLPKDCTEASLREYFQQFGTVTKCHVKRTTAEGGGQGRSRGFGFVDFESHDAVKAVLEHEPHIMGDQEIGVRAAEDRRHEGINGQQFGSAAVTRKLYVGQTADLTEEQLTNYFATFGEIEVFAHKGTYSFVTFKEQSATDRCAEMKNHAIDGLDFYTVPPKQDMNAMAKGGKGGNNFGGNFGGGNGASPQAMMSCMMGMMNLMQGMQNMANNNAQNQMMEMMSQQMGNGNGNGMGMGGMGMGMGMGNNRGNGKGGKGNRKGGNDRPSFQGNNRNSYQGNDRGDDGMSERGMMVKMARELGCSVDEVQALWGTMKQMEQMGGNGGNGGKGGRYNPY